jgi:hypothetical protein
MMAFGRSRAANALFAVALFAVVLFVNGDLPGITMPTLGQAIWTASFAQSFANSGWFSIYAHNFGIPTPAAISFGLAGALPCAWLIDLGLAPLVAYTVMFALWLGVAYLGAIVVCRRLGTRTAVAYMLAALWLCLPIVSMHVGYSMLALGIALLPTYMWAVMRVLDQPGPRNVLLLIVAALISAFMDGYTFVMFAAGAAMLCLGKWVGTRDRIERRRLLLVAGPGYVVAFGLAAALYKHYVHGGDYGMAPLSMFRAWGMDVAFAWLPTSGQFWLWDALHIGQLRDESQMYGDRSVWISTFAAPLLLAACYAAWKSRKHPLARWLAAIAVISLYLSLGPSLKINSHRPVGVTDPLMPEQAAVARTHTGYVTTHLPAVRMMRAPYRWAALGYFACWMLLVVYIGRRKRDAAWPDVVLVVALLAMVFPHPRGKLVEGMAYQHMARSIETDWIGGLRQAEVGPTLAFAPYGNDFLAAYAAARLNVRTYNVGGDKNVEQAMADWPSAMMSLGDPSQPSFADLAPFFLLKGFGDQIVIPYVDLLNSALVWPCFEPGGSVFEVHTSSACLAPTKAGYATALNALRKSPYLQVADGPLFATVSLKPAYRGPSGMAAISQDISYPVTVASQLRASRFMLTSGWHPEEPGLRWSQAKAHLTLPVPASCKGQACKVVFTFTAFAASPARAVTVIMRSHDHPDIQASTSVSDGLDHELSLSIPGDRDVFDIEVDVPDAISPAALGVSIDARVIGIDLKTIDVRP